MEIGMTLQGSIGVKLSARHWVLVAAFSSAILYVAIHVTGAHSEGYKFLDQAIRSSTTIREQIGDVKTVELSFLGEYRFKYVGDNQWVTMKLNVRGQKGDGTVAASAKKISGAWSVTDASMDGRPLALHSPVIL
jgi:Cytochrome oxidase complex assembly protein 1